MAYVPSYVDDDEEKKKDSQAITTDTAEQGTAAGTATATESTQSPLSQKGFVGIGKYLEANKEQGQELANKVVSSVDEQVQEAKKEQSDYNKSYASSYAEKANEAQKSQAESQTKLNQDWQNQLNEAYYLWQKTPSNLPPSGSGTSTHNTLRDEREAAYNELLANAPTADLESVSAPSYTPDTSAAQKAQSNLEALETQEGRQGLLTDYGTSAYTAGQRQLDATLLGAAGVGETGKNYEGVMNALLNPTAPDVTYSPTATSTISSTEASDAARKYFLEKLREEGYENPEEIAGQFARF